MLRPLSQSPQRNTLIFKLKPNIRKHYNILILSYSPALRVSVMKLIIAWHLIDNYFKCYISPQHRI